MRPLYNKMFEEWKKQKGSGSHVLMDGGVLDVPIDRLNDFYKQYVQCIKNNQKIYVVEQKTPCYNFFMDMDYVDDEAIDLETVKQIIKVVCDKIKGICGKTKCIVSVSEPKPKSGKIKTGIHLNWPGCVVDQEQALNIRSHILKHLISIYSSVDWENIIDKSVYMGSGFRLPWSYKKTKHQQCQGKGCVVCENTGKLTEGPYLPVFMYTDENIIEIDPQPSIEMLTNVTVRTDETRVNVNVETIEESQIVFKKREGNFTKKQTKNEFLNSEIQAHIETFIRQHMKGQSNARVQKIYKDGKDYLIKTNSKYCENLGREHNSNHVWFLITGDNGGNICQKCFCRCETTKERRYGFCKNYSSRPHILTKYIQDTLYPEKLKEIKEKVYTHLKDKPGLSNICMSHALAELLNLQ